MLHLNLNIQPKTAKRLKKVLEFSKNDEDFMLWAGLVEMVASNEKRLQGLEG